MATANPTQAPTFTPTPAPQDIPKYWNTFEDVTDPAANGITSDNDYEIIKITTENVDYEGGKQALEISGTLPGAKGSSLSVGFSLKQFNR